MSANPWNVTLTSCLLSLSVTWDGVSSRATSSTGVERLNRIRREKQQAGTHSPKCWGVPSEKPMLGESRCFHHKGKSRTEVHQNVMCFLRYQIHILQNFMEQEIQKLTPWHWSHCTVSFKASTHTFSSKGCITHHNSALNQQLQIIKENC